MSRATQSGLGRAAALTLGGALWIAGGCGGAESGGDTTGAEVNPIYASLAACTEGLSTAEIDDTLVISDDLSESLHELVVCGGLQASIVGALLDATFNLLQDPNGEVLPEAFSYEGEGVYRTTGKSTTMDVTFVLGHDTSFGKKGDVVKENLFVMSSYLVGAKTKVDLLEQQAEVSYTATGPLVELMGFGATPPNPIVVKLSDASKLQKELQSLEVEGVVTVKDPRTYATIAYDVTFARAPLLDAIGATGSAIDVVSLSGTRGGLGQTLESTSWVVRYDGEADAIEGAFAYKVDGKHFPFLGAVTWSAADGSQTTELSCP